jgi:hypothetical protein
MQSIGFTTGIPQKDGPDFILTAIALINADGQQLDEHERRYATRHQVYDFLETVLPLQRDDYPPYPSDAARGEDMPRWRRFLEFSVIKMMQEGLLVRTPRRREWSQDGRTEYAGAGEDDYDTAPGSRLIPTDAGWAEFEQVTRRMMKAHWVGRMTKAHRWT